VTRAVLSLSLCALSLALGLVCTFLQSSNYARADALDRLKRRCDLIEAGNEGIEAKIIARDFELERERDGETPADGAGRRGAKGPDR